MRFTLLICCLLAITLRLEAQNQLEFFFDKDPGYGKGTIYQLKKSKEHHLLLDIPIKNLHEGVHTVYFRSRNQKGLWGQTIQQTFLYRTVQSEILWAQEAEYFFDKDPGYGKGTSLQLDHSNTLDVSRLIGLQDLAEGMHTLTLRIKDNDQQWSHSYSFPFISINADTPQQTSYPLEYFFDKDPGYGKGIQLKAVEQRNFTIPLNNINPGIHTLFIRAKSTDDTWGITQQKVVLIQNGSQHTSSLKAEYYIDTDPGVGKGIPLKVPNSQEIHHTVNLENIPYGFHTLYFRVSDQYDNWSQLYQQSFVHLSVPEPIVYTEYYIDKDPGYGKGKPIPSTEKEVLHTVDLSEVEGEEHTIFIRSKDFDGHWSKQMQRSFVYCATPKAPSISGEHIICSSEKSWFQSSIIEELELYEWELSPAYAGQIVHQGKSRTQITWNPSFNGAATLKVRAMKECVAGDYSENFLVQVYNKEIPLNFEDYQAERQQGATTQSIAVTPHHNITEYSWSISPWWAGKIQEEGPKATILWKDSYHGKATITVKGKNLCNTSKKKNIQIMSRSIEN
ncbi:hypothetical protein [Algivirga pacifica]|uniref:PKD-like domain-containing protein n=1 Tax=Algivirga pacifica TaxID=1162670 RepID=A0ABP9D9Q5_9BACT